MHDSDTIVRVKTISRNEIAESLYIQQKYEEALRLADRSQHMTQKIQIGHIYQMLCSKQFDKARDLMVEYQSGVFFD